MHHMILRVRRNFFEITTKPNTGHPSELPMGRQGPAPAFELHRRGSCGCGEAADPELPRSPPWTAPRRCGGQAHTPDPPRRRSGCRSSTLRRIRSESVRKEERTERERRVSELGFRTDEADGFFVGHPWGRWWAGPVRRTRPGVPGYLISALHLGWI